MNVKVKENFLPRKREQYRIFIYQDCTHSTILFYVSEKATSNETIEGIRPAISSCPMNNVCDCCLCSLLTNQLFVNVSFNLGKEPTNMTILESSPCNMN